MFINENLKWINELNQRQTDLKKLLLLKRKDYFKINLVEETENPIVKE